MNKMKAVILFLTISATLFGFTSASCADSTRVITPKTKMLTFKLGEEKYEFNLAYCSTKERQHDNFIFVFEATASGNFRGRPAIILLAKGYPVGSTKKSSQMKMFLGELIGEQVGLPPQELTQQIRNAAKNYQTRALKEHQEKYNKAYWDSFPKDQLNEAKIASQEEMSDIIKNAKTKEYPAANGFGEMILVNKKVLFNGKQLSPYGPNAVEFKKLPQQFEIRLSCAKK